MASKDLTDALAALSQDAAGSTTRKDKALPAVKDKSAIPERTGTAKNNASAGKGGIASPLVEVAYASRTWHADSNVLTTDGLFAIVVKPVKTITFKDANDAEVVIEYKAPA